MDTINQKGFVCPIPMIWNQFYLKYSIDCNLPKPLILAAWNHTSDFEKSNRLKEQLNSIPAGIQREDAFNFLDKLPVTDWYKG